MTEPLSVLLDFHELSADFLGLVVEGPVVGSPVSVLTEMLRLVLPVEVAGNLFEDGEDAVHEVVRGAGQQVVVHDHPLVVVRPAAKNPLNHNQVFRN